MHGHALFGEVAPLAPFIPVLAEILFWFGCAVFIVLCILIVKALFGVVGGTIGKLPVVGGWINSPLHSLEHKIVGVMSDGLATVDARMGASFHALARLVDWVGREIGRHANLLATLAVLTLGGSLSAPLLALLQRLTHRADTLTRGQDEVVRRVITAENRLTQTVAHDVYPRLRAAERAIEHTIPKDVAGLRLRTKTIEGELSRLWKAVRAREAILVDTAFVGAIAVALARLGLGWLRCPALGRLGKRVGCGGFQLLEDLLAGVIDVLVIADLCQLTKLLVEIAESSEVQGVLSGIIEGIDELLLCQGVARPPALAGYWTDPPPRQAFAELPAV